jgi:hypothetical protein
VSRARKLRRSVRWARYFNHYAHLSDVIIGGGPAHRLVVAGVLGHRSSLPFLYVRRQAKHRFGEDR